MRNIGSFNARPKLKSQAEIDAEADAKSDAEDAAALANAAERAPAELVLEVVEPPSAEDAVTIHRSFIVSRRKYPDRICPTTNWLSS